MNDHANEDSSVSLLQEKSSVDLLKLYQPKIDELITMIWDEHGRIVHLCSEGRNHFNLKTTDYEAKDIKWTRFINDDSVETIQHHFQQSKDTLHLKSITLNSIIGTLHSYNADISLFTIKGEPFYIGYFTNATTIDDLRNFLADKDKLFTSSWLSAGLVHEIRNPLTSLKGFLQLVQAGIAQKEEYYNVMIDEVDKLEDITNELLLIAKPDNKEMQKKSIHKIIDDVVFIMSAQTDLRKIDFSMEIVDDLYTFGRESQLKQVLINVIKNSAEAMNGEGNIDIKACKVNGEINIMIIDNGEEMKKDQVKEMKTPFYTTKETGTGLGLVIINHILENHQGGFTLEPNENEGMTVTIHLPSVD